MMKALLTYILLFVLAINIVPSSFYLNEDKVVLIEERMESKDKQKDNISKEEKELNNYTFSFANPLPHKVSEFNNYAFTIPTLAGEVFIPPPDFC